MRLSVPSTPLIEPRDWFATTFIVFGIASVADGMGSGKSVLFGSVYVVFRWLRVIRSTNLVPLVMRLTIRTQRILEKVDSCSCGMI